MRRGEGGVARGSRRSRGGAGGGAHGGGHVARAEVRSGGQQPPDITGISEDYASASSSGGHFGNLGRDDFSRKYNDIQNLRGA